MVQLTELQLQKPPTCVYFEPFEHVAWQLLAATGLSSEKSYSPSPKSTMRASLPESALFSAVSEFVRFAPTKSPGANQTTLANPCDLAVSHEPPPVVPPTDRVASSPFGTASSGTMMSAAMVAQPIARSSTTTRERISIARRHHLERRRDIANPEHFSDRLVLRKRRERVALARRARVRKLLLWSVGALRELERALRCADTRPLSFATIDK